MNEEYKNYFEKIIDSLIKPERYKYFKDNLGNKIQFTQNNNYFLKFDIELLSYANYIIQGTLFIPLVYYNNHDKNNYKDLKPCINENPWIIYLHSHGSSQIEGIDLINYAIDINISIFTYDLCGCGKSEGEYVTMGWDESKDLDVIINFLQVNYKAGPISLWGKSMGAVASIIYCNRNPFMINSMILDSPFLDIDTLIKDIIHSKLKIPGFIIKIGALFLKNKIKSIINIDLDKVKPIEYVKNFSVPAIFISGKKDKLVSHKRIEELYNNYLCKNKNIFISNKAHSDIPEKNIIHDCFNFIKNEINLQKFEINIQKSKNNIKKFKSKQSMDILYNMVKKIDKSKNLI